MDNFTCRSCGQGFDTEEELHQHEAEMHKSQLEGTDMPICPVCSMHFETKEELEKHNKEVHGKE